VSFVCFTAVLHVRVDVFVWNKMTLSINLILWMNFIVVVYGSHVRHLNTTTGNINWAQSAGITDDNYHNDSIIT